MKRCRNLICLLLGGHAPCPGCHLRVQLTGKPPCNPSEEFISRAAAGRTSAPLHWLEEQISEELYRAALRKGAGAVDLGVWGPGVFHRDASCILEGMRPEFGYFVKGSEGR